MSAIKKVEPTLCCLLALLQVGLIFVLGLAAVNPDMHQALHAGKACPHHDCGASHGEESGEPNESAGVCPVVLLAQGIELGTIPELPTQSKFARTCMLPTATVFRDTFYQLTQRSRAPPTLLFA